MTQYPNVTLTTSSTNENFQYLRSRYLPYVDIIVEKTPVQALDILNTEYLQVINNFTPSQQYKFTTGQQITTQAFKATQTTSTWWMIALFNGYIHPLQMQDGDIVLVPNVQASINGTNSTTNPPAPSTVTF